MQPLGDTDESTHHKFSMTQTTSGTPITSSMEAILYSPTHEPISDVLVEYLDLVYAHRQSLIDIGIAPYVDDEEEEMFRRRPLIPYPAAAAFLANTLSPEPGYPSDEEMTSEEEDDDERPRRALFFMPTEEYLKARSPERFADSPTISELLASISTFGNNE